MPTLKERSAKIAADLVKSTAEAATVALNITYIQRDIQEIKQALKDIGARDDMFVLKEDFAFWRNLLVSGLLLTVAVGTIFNMLK